MTTLRMLAISRWFGRDLAAAFLLLSLGVAGCAPLLEDARNSVFERQGPDADESDYEQGKRELAAGRFGLAVLHFQAALMETPGSLDALNGLGAAFDQMGRFDLSARAYGRALALEPQDTQTLNNLGYSYFLQGRYDLAVAYLRDASIRAEGDARILGNRRLAELALARAGGPPVAANASARRPAQAAPFTPHLVRAGKGVRHLVTQPPVTGQGPAPVPRAGKTATLSPPPGPNLRGRRDLLPGFIPAPIDPGMPMAGGPALGALKSLR